MDAALTDPDRLLDPETIASEDCFAVWQWMRESSPVHRHADGIYPAFVSVTRYDDVRSVLSSPNLFSSAHGVLLRQRRAGPDPGAGSTLALTDPPRHRAMRMALAPFFQPAAVRARSARIAQRVEQMLDLALAAGVCDFSHDIAARLTFEVTADLLGIVGPDQEQLFCWAEAAFATGTSMAANPACLELLVELIHARIRQPQEDLISRLVQIELPAGTGSGTLPGSGLRNVILNIENLLGATENAGLSLAAGVASMLTQPDSWAPVRDTPRQMGAMVHEVFRWATSAVHSQRLATCRVTLAGQVVEPGEPVVVWLGSANHDPLVFPDPGRLDPCRPQLARSLALGTGEHVCIGGALAAVEAASLFAAILRRDLVIEPAAPPVPAWSLAVRGPKHLKLHVRYR